VCGAETRTLGKADHKHLEGFEMCYWRMMEKIIWTDHVRNEGLLRRVKEERRILHTIKRRNDNCIGHILHSCCIINHVLEGKIEGRTKETKRRGRSCKQLLNVFKERRK
jgi:hypothetical protein